MKFPLRHGVAKFSLSISERFDNIGIIKPLHYKGLCNECKAFNPRIPSVY